MTKTVSKGRWFHGLLEKRTSDTNGLKIAGLAVEKAVGRGESLDGGGHLPRRSRASTPAARGRLAARTAACNRYPVVYTPRSNYTPPSNYTPRSNYTPLSNYTPRSIYTPPSAPHGLLDTVYTRSTPRSYQTNALGRHADRQAHS